MKTIKILAFIIGLGLLSSAGFLYYQFQLMKAWYATPMSADESQSAKSITFQTPKGASVRLVLHKLVAEGIVADSPFIRFVGKVGEKPPAIHSGEFELSSTLSPKEILEKMASGKVKLYSFTIPPGKTIAEIAEILAEQNVGRKDRLLTLLSDNAFAESLGVPMFEGYLLPETYAIPKGYTEKAIIKRIIEMFEKKTADIERDAKSLGYTLHEAVIMASIVEKEAGGKEEYPLVSSVIHNRLARNMRLQMDPTVIYGIRKRFDGNLTRKDLQTDHPWNTYTRGGLPRSPICSPSLGALEAAVNPADTNYLYFVAKNNGSHKFSATLKEHNRAVRKYQIQGHIGD